MSGWIQLCAEEAEDRVLYYEALEEEAKKLRAETARLRAQVEAYRELVDVAGNAISASVKMLDTIRDAMHGKSFDSTQHILHSGAPEMRKFIEQEITFQVLRAKLREVADV